MTEPLVSPEEFVGLAGLTHLCAGGEAPWLKAQEQVYAEFTHLKGAGERGRSKIFEIGENCRTRLGELWGVAGDRICFLSAANDGMNLLSRGLVWNPGDNVVTTNLEFPSVAYAWRDLVAQGVEVRMVPHRDWMVAEDDLMAAVDARTRVLAVSQVSFYTGQCVDLEALSAVRQQGVLFAVDATHASGVLRVPAGFTDLCISSSYKWMLATHGVAPCYVGKEAERQLTPQGYGWHNLQVRPGQQVIREAEVEVVPMPAKMEPGNPPMLLIMHLQRALERIMEVGVGRIETHARDLARELVEGLRERGSEVIVPPSRMSSSGNTCYLPRMQNSFKTSSPAAAFLPGETSVASECPPICTMAALIWIDSFSRWMK